MIEYYYTTCRSQCLELIHLGNTQPQELVLEKAIQNYLKVKFCYAETYDLIVKIDNTLHNLVTDSK